MIGEGAKRWTLDYSSNPYALPTFTTLLFHQLDYPLPNSSSCQKNRQMAISREPCGVHAGYPVHHRSASVKNSKLKKKKKKRKKYLDYSSHPYALPTFTTLLFHVKYFLKYLTNIIQKIDQISFIQISYHQSQKSQVTWRRQRWGWEETLWKWGWGGWWRWRWQ